MKKLMLFLLFSAMLAFQVSAAEKKTATPEETAKNFLIYSTSGRVAETEKLVTAKLWKETKDFVEFAASNAKTQAEKDKMLKSCQEMFGLLEYKATVNGDKATVTAGTKGDKKPSKISLVKEKGVWKVSAVQD